MKLHWHIDVTTCNESGNDDSFTYSAVDTPEKVKDYLETTIRNIVAAKYPDGDNAFYEIRDEMNEEGFNPGIVVIATDHEHGPVIAGAMGYVMTGIDL